MHACVYVCNVPCVDVLYVAECTFELSKEFIFLRLSAVATKPELCGMQIYNYGIYMVCMHDHVLVAAIYI